MTLTRRTFLVSSTIAVVGGMAAALRLRGDEPRGTLLSAFEDARGDQFIGGMHLERHEVFGARVPARAHGCALDPNDRNRVLFFARRPGTQAFEIDLETLRARTVFTTGTGRHLAGHGVYSQAGDLLYTPEHDYEQMRGVLCVRDARTFEIVHEMDTHGVDPHEVAWLPDSRTLLVANGGIMTHPRTFRRKLNIPTMDPSLCAIDSASGACTGQWRLPDHLLSIRHLALTTGGAAAVGLQYEGAPTDAPGIVGVYRPERGLRLLEAPADTRTKFRGYVASIAVSAAQDLIAAACPYGEGVACWSLSDERYLGFSATAETYGLARLNDGSIVGSQRDGSAYRLASPRASARSIGVDREQAIRWDDHWTYVADSNG